jgi:predicted permease
MSILAYFRSLAARFLRRSQTEDDLEAELRSHIEHRAADLERSGLSRAEAQRQARIEFGGRERVREECREELGGNFIDVLAQDLRFSLRVLRKTPGFTVIAVLTLAIAIGANAVVFGVMNGMILRPLNIPQAENFYGVEHGNEHNMWESYPDYVDLRDRNRSFQDLAGFSIDTVALDASDNAVGNSAAGNRAASDKPARAWVDAVTGNFFDVMGGQPHVGRFFHASDEHGPGSAPYIVLGYNFWHSHFQDDRGVVGRSVRVNTFPFTIVGVAAPDFQGPMRFGAPDFFVPIVNQEQVEGRDVLNVRTTSTLFMTFGHLKTGVTPAQAAADLDSIGAYLNQTYPKDHGATTFVLARTSFYGNLMGGPVRAFLTALMLLSGLILLAACANLGSLFAARASDRSRDVALRLALGASRGRILRQLLTEAMLISVAGGALGLWGSVALLSALSAWNPFPRFPQMNLPVTPDAAVYVFALAVALLSGLLFGIVPVRQVLRANPYQIIKGGSNAAVRRRITVRDVLLASQIAICAVLVTSSLVAVRGLARSLKSNFGFDPRNVTLVETDLNTAGYDGDRLLEMQKRMMVAAGAIPGVESAAIIGRTPLFGGGFGAPIFTDQTTDLRPSNAVVTASRFNTSPGYLHTAGTALLAGRDFSWHDDKASPRVAIVNRELAAKIFGSVNAAVGARFKLRDGTRVLVIGVVEDGKYQSLTEDPETALFLPISQAPMAETTLVVRSARDSRQLTGALQSTVQSLDRGLPLYIESWNQQLDLPLFPARIATVSLGVLGLMGAMLSITGIFGMAAYSISKRMRELGIRVAIGARPTEVLQSALGRAFKLLVFGSAAGLILGLLAARVLASIVYQATPRDPLVLAGVVLAMLLLGLLATWIPAQRALSVDPLILLREE